MIILHAGFLEDWLLLWGEASPDTNTAPSPRRGGKSTPDLPKPYPYDAGAARLLATLKALLLAFKIEAMHTQEVAVWLPTRGDQPVPSSGLIAEPPESREDAILAPWIVTAYPLLPGEAVELLCVAMGKHAVGPGVAVGPDLTYWTEALRFSGSLTARQQYLPGLTVEDGEYWARWEPTCAGGDAERLAVLAKQMPPVARALSGADQGSPPDIPAVSCLRRFVTSCVDHLVRSPATDRAGRVRRCRKKEWDFSSVHDAWLHALRDANDTVRGDPAELARLADEIGAWRRPVAVSVASPFRLCFRLEELEESGSGANGLSSASWYVRYLLQGRDDPSLLVPAEDVWRTSTRTANPTARVNGSLRECLLSSLGQAAGICPWITASLRTSQPVGYDLHTTVAYEFLSEKAPALEQAGFGVMMPAWWAGRGEKGRLVVRARVESPDMRAGGGFSLESLVRFDCEVALGEEGLTRDELETLAKLKAPLVRLRGRWVEVRAEEIGAAVDLWKRKASGETTVRDIVQMALGGNRLAGGLEISGVTATGWIGTLLEELQGRRSYEELPVPPGFSGTLRPYQVRGYSWLCFLRRWGLGACLADDMGLGKTIQTLVLIQLDWEGKSLEEGVAKGDGKRPVLLICPTSVVSNWQKEAARFTPRLPVLVHHGLGRSRGSTFREVAENQAIVISSYALLQRDAELFQQVRWGGVVLDEAQNIKNPETKQARAARALQGDYRIALTGTPVENNVGDLWSIMQFLNPGLLGNQSEFRRTFFIPIQACRDPHAAERLKRLTGPFVLRRLKTDTSIIADLPEKMELRVFCSLTREQASLYAAVLTELEGALASAEGMGRRGAILGALVRLKQVCNHPAQFLRDNSSIPERSGKLSRLTEMLEEVIEVGDRALVFTQFAEMGETLKRYLQDVFGREVLLLHGGVERPRREHMIERFQRDGGPSVFILSLKAGGTGLNLTRANHVFHFDRWWNPAVENQATDRAFRIGQTRNVQVHKFVCSGTLEERIDEMIERKKQIAEQVVGTGESWLTELSNEQIKEIFALRREALSD